MGHLVMNYVRIDGVPAKSKAISPARFITFFCIKHSLNEICKLFSLWLSLQNHYHHYHNHISIAFPPRTPPPSLLPHFCCFPSTNTTTTTISTFLLLPLYRNHQRKNLFLLFPSPPPPPPHTLLLLSHHHQIDHHIFISLHPLALVTTTATNTFLLFSLLPKELFFFLSYSLIVAPLP